LVPSWARRRFAFSKIFNIARAKVTRLISAISRFAAFRRGPETHEDAVGRERALRDLLEEAASAGAKIIEEKKSAPERRRKDLPLPRIGIGAVKYADLSQYRMTD